MFDKHEWASALYPKTLSGGRPLTRDEAYLLMDLYAIESTADLVEVDASMQEELPMYRVVKHRLELINAEFSPVLIMYLVTLSEGNMGNALMLAFGATVFNKKLSLAQYCMDVTPFAIPDGSLLSRQWDAQKIDGKNAIDDCSFWED